MALLTLSHVPRVRLLVLLAAAMLVGGRASAQESIEKDVKAAYLYNFAKFVEWPDAANTSKEFRICVVGDPAFAMALDRIIVGENAAGRQLVRADAASPDAARACQILYIGRQLSDGGDLLLGAVRRSPVLTVGESSTFLDRGGVIRFVTVDGRVRFDINPAAADLAGVRISSKLLRVARSLKGAT